MKAAKTSTKRSGLMIRIRRSHPRTICTEARPKQHSSPARVSFSSTGEGLADRSGIRSEAEEASSAGEEEAAFRCALSPDAPACTASAERSLRARGKVRTSSPEADGCARSFEDSKLRDGRGAPRGWERHVIEWPDDEAIFLRAAWERATHQKEADEAHHVQSVRPG